MSGLPSYESLYPSNEDEPPSYFESPKATAQVRDTELDTHSDSVITD